MMKDCCMYTEDEKHCKGIYRKLEDCNRSCGFYKTNAEQEESLKKSQKRCFMLDIPFGEEYVRLKGGK
jgi:hypothetical protein